MTKKVQQAQAEPFLYPHAESNRNRQNRNLKFYPLNYKGIHISITKVVKSFLLFRHVFRDNLLNLCVWVL